MIVRRAETLGMCKGVRRALRLVEETLARNPGTPAYSLGPLVHNPAVVEDLKARGLTPVDDLSTVREGIVIIRTHGIGPGQRRQCERPGIHCIDATCRHVLHVHKLVRDHDAAGRQVVIAGDPLHAEVRGIAEHAKNAVVVATEAEAEQVPLSPGALVVSQTTMTRSEFERITAVLRRREPSLHVEDTTCAATERRLESLQRLAVQVDALLVIGGRQSANTRRLFEAATATGRPSWHIEGAGDIPSSIRSFARVGITAGASTPDRVIDEVEEALLVFSGDER